MWLRYKRLTPIVATICAHFRSISRKSSSNQRRNTIVEYHLHPTDDFLAAILALGGDAEVLSHQWCHDYVREEIQRLYSRYL